MEKFIKNAVKMHDLMSKNEEYRLLVAKSATTALTDSEKKRKCELERS